MLSTLLILDGSWLWYLFIKQMMAIVQKWAPYSQRYLFNAIPDTNHNANPTSPTNPTNHTNPNTRYRCE